MVNDVKYIGRLKIRNLKGGEVVAGGQLAPILGQKGIPMPKFCVAFNELTSHLKGQVLRANVLVYSDKTFKIQIGYKRTTEIILEYLKREKGSSAPGSEMVANLTQEDLENIAKIKEKDLNSYNLSKAIKIIAGVARSMGINSSLQK